LPPRSPALASSASARVEAAKKLGVLAQAEYQHGTVGSEALFAAEELQFRAVRDSGVVGPELVDAATSHLAATRQLLALIEKRKAMGISGGLDLARGEYAVAEAEYWLEEAKTRR
jgi:hypothetical protein